jgi:2,3-bisphosphoglycerate-independent phosphoglycerate mutase
VSDQWLEPYVIVGEDDKPVGAIEDGDSVLIFNFRAGAAAASCPDIGE